MKRWCFLVALLALGCSKTIDDRGAEIVDFRNPKRVLASVFFAAKYAKADHLGTLCDPNGDANKHALRICGQTANGNDWPAFVKQFSQGRLIGEARVSGDRALINFVFGPKGIDPETMELVRRDGNWFLLAF